MSDENSGSSRSESPINLINNAGGVDALVEKRTSLLDIVREEVAAVKVWIGD